MLLGNPNRYFYNVTSDRYYYADDLFFLFFSLSCAVFEGAEVSSVGGAAAGSPVRSGSSGTPVPGASLLSAAAIPPIVWWV